jgi:hypothetical protein
MGKALPGPGWDSDRMVKNSWVFWLFMRYSGPLGLNTPCIASIIRAICILSTQ